MTYNNIFNKTTDDIIFRAYGTSKIHKQGMPMKIIIATINSYYIDLHVI